MAEPASPYEILGVPRDATARQIKRAYRALAKKHHPDVSKDPDAARQFIRVEAAYETLRDPQKRRECDLALSPQQEARPDASAAPLDRRAAARGSVMGAMTPAQMAREGVFTAGLDRTAPPAHAPSAHALREYRRAAQMVIMIAAFGAMSAIAARIGIQWCLYPFKFDADGVRVGGISLLVAAAILGTGTLALCIRALDALFHAPMAVRPFRRAALTAAMAIVFGALCACTHWVGAQRWLHPALRVNSDGGSDASADEADGICLLVAAVVLGVGALAMLACALRPIVGSLHRAGRRRRRHRMGPPGGMARRD